MEQTPQTLVDLSEGPKDKMVGSTMTGKQVVPTKVALDKDQVKHYWSMPIHSYLGAPERVIVDKDLRLSDEREGTTNLRKPSPSARWKELRSERPFGPDPLIWKYGTEDVSGFWLKLGDALRGSKVIDYAPIKDHGCWSLPEDPMAKGPFGGFIGFYASQGFPNQMFFTLRTPRGHYGYGTLDLDLGSSGQQALKDKGVRFQLSKWVALGGVKGVALEEDPLYLGFQKARTTGEKRAAMVFGGLVLNTLPEITAKRQLTVSFTAFGGRPLTLTSVPDNMFQVFGLPRLMASRYLFLQHRAFESFLQSGLALYTHEKGFAMIQPNTGTFGSQSKGAIEFLFPKGEIPWIGNTAVAQYNPDTLTGHVRVWPGFMTKDEEDEPFDWTGFGSSLGYPLSDEEIQTGDLTVETVRAMGARLYPWLKKGNRGLFSRNLDQEDEAQAKVYQAMRQWIQKGFDWSAAEELFDDKGLARCHSIFAGDVSAPNVKLLEEQDVVRKRVALRASSDASNRVDQASMDSYKKWLQSTRSLNADHMGNRLYPPLDSEYAFVPNGVSGLLEVKGQQCLVIVVYLNIEGKVQMFAPLLQALSKDHNLPLLMDTPARWKKRPMFWPNPAYEVFNRNAELELNTWGRTKTNRAKPDVPSLVDQVTDGPAMLVYFASAQYCLGDQTFFGDFASDDVITEDCQKVPALMKLIGKGTEKEALNTVPVEDVTDIVDLTTIFQKNPDNQGVEVRIAQFGKDEVTAEEALDRIVKNLKTQEEQGYTGLYEAWFLYRDDPIKHNMALAYNPKVNRAYFYDSLGKTSSMNPDMFQALQQAFDSRLQDTRNTNPKASGILLVDNRPETAEQTGLTCGSRALTFLENIVKEFKAKPDDPASYGQVRGTTEKDCTVSRENLLLSPMPNMFLPTFWQNLRQQLKDKTRDRTTQKKVSFAVPESELLSDKGVPFHRVVDQEEYLLETDPQALGYPFKDRVPSRLARDQKGQFYVASRDTRAALKQILGYYPSRRHASFKTTLVPAGKLPFITVRKPKEPKPFANSQWKTAIQANLNLDDTILTLTSRGSEMKFPWDPNGSRTLQEVQETLTSQDWAFDFPRILETQYDREDAFDEVLMLPDVNPLVISAVLPKDSNLKIGDVQTILQVLAKETSLPSMEFEVVEEERFRSSPSTFALFVVSSSENKDLPKSYQDLKSSLGDPLLILNIVQAEKDVKTHRVMDRIPRESGVPFKPFGRFANDDVRYVLVSGAIPIPGSYVNQGTVQSIYEQYLSTLDDEETLFKEKQG